MAGTMQDKGADYVKAWPGQIARQFGLSPVYVIRALNEVTGGQVAESAAYANDYIEDVAALTPDAARAVVTTVRRINAEITEHARTHCHTCGLPIKGNECAECI